VHSPDDSDHPASNDASRAASLAALTGGSVSGQSNNGTLTDSYPTMGRQASLIKEEYMTDTRRSSTAQNPVQRFQERKAGPMSQGSMSGSSFDQRGTYTKSRRCDFENGVGWLLKFGVWAIFDRDLKARTCEYYVEKNMLLFPSRGIRTMGFDGAGVDLIITQGGFNIPQSRP
jgi:hypothetical protein